MTVKPKFCSNLVSDAKSATQHVLLVKLVFHTSARRREILNDLEHGKITLEQARKLLDDLRKSYSKWKRDLEEGKT